MAETVITKGYKNSNINLTKAYVQELFEYNPETGILVWKQHNTAEDAHEAYKKGIEKLRGHFNNI